MLTPQEIEALADSVVDAYQALDTSMRVAAAKGLNLDADRQAVQRAIASAGSPKEIERAIVATYSEAAKTTTASDQQIYGVARAAGLISSGGDAVAVNQLITLAVTNAVNTHNLVLTSAVNAISTEYVAALDKAAFDVAIGARTSDEAIREAVDTLARSQTTVQYVNSEGVLRTDTLYTAVRRNVVTGVNQMTGRITDARMDYFGVQWVEVSAHAGARPDHAEWQGQVIERSRLAEVTGYGSVDGLEGANCRHSHAPFFPGVNEPTDYSDLDSLDNQREYELSQRQRLAERNARTYDARAQIYEAGGDAKKAEANTRLTQKWQDESARVADLRRDFARPERMRGYPGEARWPE